MTDRLIPEERRQAIVAAYKGGKRIRDMEEEFGVSRSSIYWVLQQENVAPQRTKPSSRLKGDTHDLVQLYTIIEAQEARIDALEAFIVINGLEIPEE